MRDPNTEPTKKTIAEGLGAANSAYTKFAAKLKNHGIQLEWRYYNDGKSWLAKGIYGWATPRGTQKETTVFWLSVWEGFFKVSIFIPEKARADALNLNLGSGVTALVKNSKQMGKLKFFPLVFDLQSEEFFDDLFTLVNFRKNLK